MTKQSPEGLEPCPFCGGTATIERYGTPRVTTIYGCDNCSCTLETDEEWGHGKGWNTRSPSPALAEAVRALEEAQYAFDCIAEDFEISDGCTAEMLCGDKICEGGCIDRRRQVIRTALTNLRNLMGKEGGS